MATKAEMARETARILLDTKSVFISAEPITYTSGRKGPVYVDCRRLISFVKERSTLMDFAAACIKSNCPDVDIIAGGETAGIPYAAFVSDRMQKPMIYIRKKPKGIGRNAQIEGSIEAGNKVVITEDVQNYGVSVKVFVDALRTAEAKVDTVFVIFTYGHESTKKEMAALGMNTIALCNWQDVIALAREEKRFDAALLDSVDSFLKDPVAWSVAHGGKGEDISTNAA